MPNVTVQSAHGLTATLAYDSSANALLASYVAGAIQSGFNGGTIVPADSAFSGSRPPPLAAGKIGEWVQDTTGSVPTITKGYDYIVAAAPSSTITDQNPDTNQAVLVGSGMLNFNALGAGSIIGGGGNDIITVPVADSGAWNIVLGNGNDTIRAFGSGNDTISLGSGNDSIYLGSGHSLVTTGGAASAPGGSATITASTGFETVTGYGTTIVNGGSSHLVFVGGGGSTIFGGSGSDTVTGGTGPDVFHGGTGGNNFLTAGSGAATLFGGGNGDQLFATGSGAQILFAGSGNETLTGSSSTGSDTFVGGAGSATAVAHSSTTNLFEFINGSAGGTVNESGLGASDVHIHLAGYGGSEQSNAIATQTNTAGNTTLVLSDGTHITFNNVASINSSNFS